MARGEDLKKKYFSNFTSLYCASFCSVRHLIREEMPFEEFQDGCHARHQSWIWEHSGSVVEFLTRDRGATGSSLTGVTVLCP